MNFYRCTAKAIRLYGHSEDIGGLEKVSLGFLSKGTKNFNQKTKLNSIKSIAGKSCKLKIFRNTNINRNEN
jgi:hypothetical protein